MVKTEVGMIVKMRRMSIKRGLPEIETEDDVEHHRKSIEWSPKPPELEARTTKISSIEGRLLDTHR